MGQPPSISKPLDTPIHQPFYHFTNNTWEPLLTTPNPNPTTNPTSLETLTLTTWNIDFRAPYADKRMTQALHHLSTLHNTTNTNSTPSIIFLQEMLPSDLLLIQQTPWIQTHFYITDISSENWRSRYGTTALIEKRLDVKRVFRVLYSASRMGRDALFFDVAIKCHGNSNCDSQEGGDGGEVTGAKAGDPILRLCNTHLESLASNPPIRPVQLRIAARFMYGTGTESENENESAQTVSSNTTTEEISPIPPPHASILAGDLNAFAPEDQTAPGECGLQDAFLVLGGQEGSEEGFTWGQQRASYDSGRFGPSRMDKVLFCGGVEVQSLQKIGVGETIWIEYPQESDSEEDSETGEDLWVTDHIGLRAVFRVR